MRLALKITLAVTAWTLLVLLVGGQLRLQRELELFDADMRQDSELLGAVLRAAVQDAHASGGWAAVDELILESGATVRVEVGCGEGRAPLSEGGQEGRWARISVTDEGPGVPLDLRDRIFEPFVTTKERGEGTGLGLSIAAEIIHEHGGWIAADFERRHGSRFTIHLPLPVTA